MNIEVKEICNNSSAIGTNSLRVVFKGTNIGTNGKGVDENYCKASAYAELFERFSNNFINPVPDHRDIKKKFKKFPDEVYMTAKELISQNDDFLNYYFKNRDSIDKSLEEKAEMFESVNVPEINGEEKKYLAVPFYDVKNNRCVYLPYGSFMHHYGSNGMAAGNTPAEAMVQGLSEIIERLVQTKIINEQLYLPDIPDEEIKKYPYVYDMFMKAKNFKNLSVMMKDCSLGGKYPVAGLLIIEKNTGKYGLKLGCHPDLGIAMERTLTEATQGGEITAYANRSYVDFSNKSVYSPYNLMNSFATGKAQFPYQVLADTKASDFKFFNNERESNDEIIKSWIKDIIDDGYNVLIRDNSWLDFPAFHMVIPGLSEAFSLTDRDIKGGNTCSYLKDILQHPLSLGVLDYKLLRNYLNYTRGNILTDNIKAILPFSKQTLFAESNALSTRYLSIICDIVLEDYQNAYQKFSIMNNSIDKYELMENSKIRFRAEFIYLSAFMALKSHAEAMNYIRLLFSDEISDFIDETYKDHRKIMEKILPEITEEDIKEEIKLNADIYHFQDALESEIEKKKINQLGLSRIVSDFSSVSASK